VRVVSEGLLGRLAAIAPRVREKAIVAPMPLAIDDVELAARVSARGRALRAGFDRPLHVVASRLVREKRIERAIDHAARVRAPLVLVGDGPERAALLDRAQRRGLDLRTTGALPHEDALAWIAAADVLLAPLAPGEGAPTAIREAHALGVRVLAFP
jgi:glycosyltransferase involved in cell wall biosynthesis